MFHFNYIFFEYLTKNKLLLSRSKCSKFRNSQIFKDVKFVKKNLE